MNPAIITTVFSIVKGIAGLNTKKHYEAKTGKPRPALLSRRAIGTMLASASTLVALFTGVQVPDGEITSIVDMGYQAVDLVKQNKELGLAAWGVVAAIIGHFKREK